MSVALRHSPADILCQLLIDLEEGTEFSEVAGWPVYVSAEPNAPDNVITVYNTSPQSDGRSMIDGEQWQHYGFQVRVRAATESIAYLKAEVIRRVLNEEVYRTTVTIGGESYLVHACTRISIISVGKESGISSRRIFTINGLITVRPTGIFLGTTWDLDSSQDRNIAVGPHSVLTANLNGLNIYTRKGTTVQERSHLIQFSSPFGYDPRVIYHPYLERFLYVAFDINTPGVPNDSKYSISKDNNPLTLDEESWDTYELDYGTDFPILGFTRDGFAVAWGSVTGGGSIPVGNSTLTFIRADGTLEVHNDSNNESTISQAWPSLQWDGEAGEPYWALRWGQLSAHLYAIKITNPFSSSFVDTVKYDLSIAVSPGARINAVSPTGTLTTSSRADTQPQAVIKTVRGKRRGVLAHAGNKDGFNKIFWYEVDLSNESAPVLLQQGILNDGVATHELIGCIDINRQGTILITYTQTSATVTPKLMLAARRYTDPVGTLPLSKEIKNTGGNMPNFGAHTDNTIMVSDPNNDSSWLYDIYEGVGNVRAALVQQIRIV